MVQEEGKTNKKELEDSLGKELDSKKSKLENKEKEINLFRNSLSEKSDNYIKDIHEAEEQAENEAQQANNIISSARTRINSFISDFTDRSKSLKKYIWIIFAAFLASFFIPYFAIPVIYTDPAKPAPIEPALLSMGITIACFIVLVYKVSRSIDSKLFKPGEDKSLGQLQEDSSSVTQDKIKFSSKKEKFNQKLQELNEGIRKIISVSEEYIPGLREYYAGMALKTKQEHFAYTLRNALRNYGLLDHSIEKKLVNYSNLAHTDEEWLEDASSQISEIMGISKEILQLAYYDYVDSRTGVNNVWNSITVKGQIKELVNILKNSLVLENRTNLPDEPFVEIISNIGTFSIEGFKRLYNEFYNNLEKEKTIILQTLENLGLSIDSEKRKSIDGFFPTTTKTEDWSYQLINKAAEVLQQNTSILWLFYLDKTGQTSTRDSFWQKEKTNPEFIAEISDFIVQSSNKQNEFERDDLKKLCSEIISNENSFDVSKIIEEFAKRIATTKRIKSLFAYSLEAKKVPIPQKIRENQFEKLIAFGSEPETEIAKKIGLLLDINKDIVSLFYFDYVQSPKERQESFDNIKKDGNLDRLASLLLEGGFVRGESKNNDENKMLSNLLKSLPEFDVDNIRISYSFYRKIFNDTTSFIHLLDEQKIKNSGEVKFEKIVEILQNVQTPSRFEALEKIAQTVVDKNQWKNLSEDEFEALISSALVIYLIKYFDRAREDACIKASTNELAVKALYEWVDRKNDEKRFGKQKSTLVEVVSSVFDETVTKFEHINDFRRSLEEGKLFGSTDELLGARFADLKKEIVVLQNDRSLRLLDRAKDQITKIMGIQITNDFIIQTLKSQVISAYMITYKEGPVIRVIKDYLKTACESLSNNDDRFRNLIIMKTDESLTGKGTRVGVVPLRIKDFEEFSTLFHRAFKTAVDNLKNEDKDYQGKTFSANLIRVIPSDLTFKSIQIGPEDSETKVIESITELVRTELSPSDRIQIAASARENEPATVALREIISLLFDKNAKLIAFVDDATRNMVNENPKLNKIFGNEQFDSELRNRYNLDSNTALAVHLFRSDKQNHDGTLVQFTEEIKSILRTHGIDLNETQLTSFSKSLLETLLDIAGLVVRN